MRKTSLFIVVGIAMLVLQGCVTNIYAPQEPNQPSEVKLSTFNQVQFDKTTIDPQYEGSGANQKAVTKINELLEQQLRTVFPKLNGKSTEAGKILLIKPHAEAIKFINGNARFWAGPMAGSSAIILRVDYIDKDTGKVIASPRFYGKSSAMAGAMSVGGNDNAMLHRVVTEVIKYSQTNR